MKDTRFYPTLKHWKSVVKVGHYVVCLRYPEESVLFLRWRQKLPLWMGYRFWNFNMSTLLKELPLEGGVDSRNNLRYPSGNKGGYF
jgi:hypothetical protein